MRGKFDRYSLRLFWIFGVLLGATAALASQGGCVNTFTGVGRDLAGAWDGMMSVAESNGESVRTRRGN